MHPKHPSLSQPPSRAVVGAGLIALDVVVPEAPDAAPRMQAGGTCGNVLAALAYLDWTAYPIARLGDDGPMHRVCQDLAKWGVRLDFVLKESGDGTPVIAQYIRKTASGATHSFSWRCPTCGADLPRYKPLRITDVERLLPLLPEADVFFFDRASPGVIRVATYYRQRGAIVAFEPSSVGDVRLFHEAVSVAQLVKYSRERVKASEALEDDHEGPGLLIETSGEEGLRFRARLPGVRNKRWKLMPAIQAQKVRDTAGCGDWCTAGILHILATDAARSFFSADEELLTEAIRYGQALAAWNCGFEGARGGMYDITKSEFQASIAALLAGESTQEIGTKAVPPETPVPSQFPCPACPSTRSSTSVEKR